MGMNSWWQQVVDVIADGTALTNSVAQTSLLTGSPGASPAVWTLPANTLQVGTELLIRASGRISTVVTTPGTLTFTVKIGSVNALVSQAMALNVTAQTNQTWELEIHATARQIGSSTNTQLMFTGKWTSRAVVGSSAAGSGGVGVLLIPETAPAVGTGFDSTASQAIDLQATWSVASASNSIQLHQYSLSIKN
jgi:hypothetical protein